MSKALLDSTPSDRYLWGQPSPDGMVLSGPKSSVEWELMSQRKQRWQLSGCWASLSSQSVM